MDARLQQRYYSKLTEFVADVTKVFENCRYYNPPDSPFYQCAEQLEDVFVQKLKSFKAGRSVPRAGSVLSSALPSPLSSSPLSSSTLPSSFSSPMSSHVVLPVCLLCLW